jgi:Ca2+-binding EF-hand superfamily protein
MERDPPPGFVAPLLAVLAVAWPLLATGCDSRAPPLPASLPRPTFPMSAAAHRQFRDAEFALRDTNRDGVLSIDEIRAALLRETGDQDPERIKRAMRVNCGFDTVACTKQQYDAQGDAEFRRVDRDHDGFITCEELAAVGGSMHLEAP